MAGRAPEDEFELLLEHCRARLSEIDLRLPELEGPGPSAETRRIAALAVLEEPPAPPAPPPARAPEPPPQPSVEAEPEPPAVPADAPAAPAPEPPPLPSVEAAREAEPEEIEVFPPPTPAAAPAPQPRRLRALAKAAAAAAALAAVAAAGLWLARRPVPDLAVELSGADAFAVRPDRGDVLVAAGRELLRLSPNGALLDRKPFDGPVRGLSWDRGAMWSDDGSSPSVVETPEEGRPTVFRLNHVPSDLFVRDKYLWTAEKGSRTLHEYLISRSILGVMLQPLDAFDLPEMTPETFCIDESGVLWLVDAATRRLYKLAPEAGSYRPVLAAPLSPLIGPEGGVRDLSVDRGSVWLLTVGGGKSVLRRLDQKRLDWTQP